MPHCLPLFVVFVLITPAFADDYDSLKVGVQPDGRIVVPTNQLDLSATTMRNCFQSTPDLTAYTALPNNIALDEMNPPLIELKGLALHWAKESLKLPLDEPDEADEDTLNRIIWRAMRGEEPYPQK